QISYLGYATQEMAVGTQTRIQIVLKESAQALDEVVVVAYGTQKVRSLTGAMSKLNTDELTDMPAQNIGQKLQGKFAGVQINQANGAPNRGLNIRVRGQASANGGNSPLIVVDGFPVYNGLETLSPDEIETISILKDAASAGLYGSRAANGVILVTTKSAKAGKTQIEFSTNVGWEKVGEKGRPDFMNAQEFAQFKKETYEDAARYEGYTGGVPDVWANPASVQDGTDWYRLLLQTGMTQNYNLSLTSGTDKVRSSVNVNYNRTEGVLMSTYADRFSARANNLFTPNERITFGLNLSASYLTQSLGGSLENGHYDSYFVRSFLMDPQLKYMNDDGTYPISFAQPGMLAMPNFYLMLKKQEHPEARMISRNNVFGEVKIIDGLKYRISGNIELYNRTYREWLPSDVCPAGLWGVPPNPASGRYDTEKNVNWLVENTLSFDRTFAEKHHVDALLGYTTQKIGDESTSISAVNYPDDEVSWINAAASRVGTGSVWEMSLISYLARLNYDFAGKYLLSATLRRDGCSRFGPNRKYANFPSFSAGWIASDEAFLSDIDRLSHLKIRGSYGKVGNYNIGNYEWIPEAGTANYVTNGSISAGRTLSRIGNEDLTWETTEQYDLGLELGLFNDRIFFVYDYYRKTTDGLLYSIDIPTQTGFSSIRSNIGEFRFWGHEFGIESKNLVGELKWNTNLNITFNRNKAVKLGTNDTPIGGYGDITGATGNDNRTAVGKPLGLFYGYIFDGIFMTQAEYEAGPKLPSSNVGTVRYKDLDGNGIINQDDKTFIGDPNPDFVYGITNEFAWKNFDASIVMSGAVGGDILDGSMQWTEVIEGVFNIRKDVANRWRSEENPGNGIYPRTLTGTMEPFRYVSTRYIHNGSYLMVKNVTVGYTLPVKPNSVFKGLRVYASGQNLLTLTGYYGQNPEVSLNGSNGLQQGVDWFGYPVAKVFSVGLNVKF
ncbi:MAG: TonB-dependent receptor, partial [Tannerella sp.]|nr:TonB-dependent receptor [Tannerella sp.]